MDIKLKFVGIVRGNGKGGHIVTIPRSQVLLGDLKKGMAIEVEVVVRK